VENAGEDAKKLLVAIGAWDEYGKTGWGKDGTLAVLGTREHAGAGSHANYAQDQVWKWYTPEWEVLVEQFYHGDYENPLFNFTGGQCLTCITESDKQAFKL
jgi:hypothetical protein